MLDNSNSLQVTLCQTSQVPYEVVEFHFPICFYVLIVQVSVEHDGGECQQKHGVRPVELPHCLHVALTVTIGKRL